MAQSRTVISLFTGCGGLDLGLEAAGFRTLLCVEKAPAARATIAANRPLWRLSDPGDIFELGPGAILEQAGVAPGEATMLAGGPPCQPWSRAANWASGAPHGLGDDRSKTLRAWLDVLKSALPEVILLENVLGLSSLNSGEGLSVLLSGIEDVNRSAGTDYRPVVFSADAADFGVPQHRKRMFVIAHRGGLQFAPPSPTHGETASGPSQPFVTAWDAIGHLQESSEGTELRPAGKWASLLPSVPEGANYLWHTSRGGGEPLFGWRTKYWSFLLKLAKDRPAWTIPASPGPATGPFHWRSRLLSVDEMGLLQTLPTGYRVAGNRRQAQEQIGNAVPSALAELLGLEIRRQLLADDVSAIRTLLPTQGPACPPPEVATRVPEQFLSLRGIHRDHPGPGQGPRASLRRSRP